ncbi:MAG: LAGLIDADG family homing endonuclease [Candidatus Caldarchaeales archaeon]
MRSIPTEAALRARPASARGGWMGLPSVQRELPGADEESVRSMGPAAGDGGSPAAGDGDVTPMTTPLRGWAPERDAFRVEVVDVSPSPGGDTAGGGRKKRRKTPKDLMIPIYDDVRRMREKGTGYRQIIREVERKYGVRLSTSVISYWVRGIHTPHGTGTGRPPPRGRRRFRSIEELTPSPDLACVIGAVFGDGTVSIYRTEPRGRTGLIRLRVKDCDFAVAFAQALGRVLNRDPPPIREETIRGRKSHVVEVKDITLCELLIDRDIESIRRFVEHDDACRAAFLRGFYDSEGSVGPRNVNVYNTGLRILGFVREQLMALGIDCTKPRLNRRAGTPVGVGNGEYFANTDLYTVIIRGSNLQLFLKKVGFSIERKKQRLVEIVRKRMLWLMRLAGRDGRTRRKLRSILQMLPKYPLRTLADKPSRSTPRTAKFATQR